MEQSLFGQARPPLAARLRPRSLEEFIGQEHILGPGKLLRRAIEADQLQSLILSGPPGTGKTTLARVIAEKTCSQFISVNAVLSGVKDIREAITRAQSFSERTGQRTILFVDEVHRWNKSQQDALLPWVEEGLFILVGATTENPFFEVNKALLSRSRVFLLTSLTEKDLHRVIDFALGDTDRGYGRYPVNLARDARDHLVRTASGDARTLLNALELAVETSGDTFPPAPGISIEVTLEIAEDSIQRRAVLYDKDGDYHFDTISAFIKSLRGSDPDAALYWLARMILAGEDPRYILRRLLILAAEDVGLADPEAISRVTACADAFDRVGMPEGQFHLAQATLYCAMAPKSNSTLGYFDAIKAVQEARSDDVPSHLQDPSRDGPSLGHGHGYLYPHAYRDHWVAQQYLPETLQGNIFYHPGDQGWEGSRRQVLEERRRLQLAAEQEQPLQIYTLGASRGASSRWLQRMDEATLEEATALRDQALALLGPLSTDRVLLCGASLQLFLWETLRRTPGGLTLAWGSDQRDIESMRHLLERSPLEDLEAPRIAGPTEPGIVPAEAGDYSGPFDRILCRLWPGDLPLPVLERLLPLIAPGGTLLFLDLDPSRGTVPSRLLGDLLSLPARTGETLSRAEKNIFPPRPPLWEEALSRLPLPEESHGIALQSWIHTKVQRKITPPMVQSWFGADQPLTEEILRLGEPGILEELRRRCEGITPGDYAWERAFLAVKIAKPA
ncbi:hypothetical protein AU468_13115 [Alkalispirochaeta sphaeroplastigenens]|uniref:Replication-associated recombination protein A n=1 Tax=Alkalispirochaeta sphaeroplastigenens TaxID=1187066 RepID=A0A2S4JG31_9SPIO|nr:AAA family ATPase [Alkalispirochaeta sphaeroplastigenens]POQ98518.1 hypothetical protein AU468_13115 [Alkalispirochaeta sphaeroplastigenens]